MTFEYLQSWPSSSSCRYRLLPGEPLLEWRHLCRRWNNKVPLLARLWRRLVPDRLNVVYFIHTKSSTQKPEYYSLGIFRYVSLLSYSLCLCPGQTWRPVSPAGRSFRASAIVTLARGRAGRRLSSIAACVGGTSSLLWPLRSRNTSMVKPLKSTNCSVIIQFHEIVVLS